MGEKYGTPLYPPGMTPSLAVPTGMWTTGLCGCFEDCESCCCTFFCPCVTVGRNIEIISDGYTECCVGGVLYTILQTLGFGCCYLCTYRKALRRKYELPAQPCHDCCVHFCCPACVICQEYRELKNRGWNPALGYKRSVQFQPESGTPPYGQRMYK